ncbi:MAG TPA: hypothetical protein VGQ48_06785 [Gemmatimonadales bacterium]|jgi:uncharacterized protein YbaR (Trm112 family)|nr:hypothetical protein [Gemmatimonadales bacterium]
MHIELTEMLRCPEAHREEMLVLSTGEVKDRMVRSGLVGCPVCHKEYPIARGIVNFRRSRERVSNESSGPRAAVYTPPSPLPSADAANLQALLELSGPGGYVVLIGSAVRQAPRLSSLMEGMHFVGINAPLEMEEQATLSLLYANERIPLRTAMARGVVVGADLATSHWLVEAHRVLLPGRRFVVENEEPELPIGLVKLAAENGLWVGEKR